MKTRRFPSTAMAAPLKAVDNLVEPEFLQLSANWDAVQRLSAAERFVRWAKYLRGAVKPSSHAQRQQGMPDEN
jgi:hypothetical protein